MPENLTRIGIGLCAGLENQGGGLEPDAIAHRLKDAVPDVQVEIVPDLCQRPDRVLELASHTGAPRLVLGLCEREPTPHEFQGWTRKAGLDPFAIRLVHLQSRGVDGEDSRDTDDAVLLLKAAIAGLRTFEGSDPEQLKLSFLNYERKLSRRSLVSLPPWTYEAVPMIDPDLCLGEKQCGLCAPACPFEAIKEQSGSLFVEKVRCEACGLCVTTCPARAITWPGSSLEQYEAELEVLLSVERVSLVFVCQRAYSTLTGTKNGESPLPAGWFPIEVPCMGMVTPGWILQALAGGAETVALMTCGKYCKHDKQAVVGEGVAYLHELLDLLGIDRPTERVRVLPTEKKELEKVLGSLTSPQEPGRSVQEPGRDGAAAKDLALTEPAATSAAVLRLAEIYEAPSDLSLTHDASPLGVVSVREGTCTTCGACPDACMTGALSMSEEDGTMLLSFDATRCTNCGHCVPVCPEAKHDTLSVEGATDLTALREGRVTKKVESIATCRKCGRQVAPTAMLSRIEDLIQDDETSEKLLKTVTELCPDCRAADTSVA